MKTNRRPCLGVDFGRVIQGADLPSGKADTVFLSGSHEQALRSPATEGAYEALSTLVPLFEGRAWVISKCGERIQRRTLDWLHHNDFYQRTGIPRGNVRFCRKRADKAGHCTELAVTHMIDDRFDVHQALRGIVPNLYLFGPQQEPAPEWLRHTATWPDVTEAITASIAAEPH